MQLSALFPTGVEPSQWTEVPSSDVFETLYIGDSGLEHGGLVVNGDGENAIVEEVEAVTNTEEFVPTSGW